MFCPYCGKQIEDGSKHCQYCGRVVTQETTAVTQDAPAPAPVTAPAQDAPASVTTPPPVSPQPPAPAPSGAWYKKWWIWVIAGVVVAAIVVACIFIFMPKGPKKVEPKKTETTVAATTAQPTTAPVTAATLATAAPKKESIDDIIAKGFEKTGYIALYNNTDKYKGKKIITAAEIQDIGENALYFVLTDGKKKYAFYEFQFKDKEEIKDIRKGEFAAIYGTVNEEGMLGSHIEIMDCHIAAVKDEAKKFFDSIKDEKLPVPTQASTTKPVATTSAKKETTSPEKKETTAPERPTEKPSQKPTEKPAPTTTEPFETVQPTTKGEDNVLFNENGINVVYAGYEDDDDYITFKVNVENKSGKNFYVGAVDSKVNGKPIDLLAFDYVEAGKTAEADMYVIRFDLEEAGIQAIDDLTFKFIFEYPDDWEHPLITKEIKILTTTMD